MKIFQMQVGPMANFAYLLVDPATREGAVLDSGWETAPILRQVDESGCRARYVIATHGHFDHTATAKELAGQLQAETVAHASSPFETDVRVVDGEELRVGGARLKVLHTPGHTEDSICIYEGGSVFTGDVLFVGTIGRFERSMAESMYGSLHRVILGLPRSTVFYPGHDYGEVPSSSLGEEMASNPFLMTSDFRDFAALFS